MQALLSHFKYPLPLQDNIGGNYLNYCHGGNNRIRAGQLWNIFQLGPVTNTEWHPTRVIVMPLTNCGGLTVCSAG